MKKVKSAQKMNVQTKAEVVDHPVKIILNDEELVNLRTKQQELVVLKVDLANLYLHLQKVEDSIEGVSSKILDKEDEYMEEAKKIAMDHGVNTDSPEAGKWNLNLDEKTLNKI